VAKRVVHDLFDRFCATAALGTAAKAAIDLAATARRVLFDDAAHVMIRNHIARTDNHCRSSSLIGKGSNGSQLHLQSISTLYLF
jgi:hypothetical protein